ncbi:MAG: RIP metalloprotease RseP [Cypionkella sp.]
MDFNSLIASTGNAAWAILFFLLALSFIVAVHEYGHYIVGRWSGIHAEVFSLGFGPVIYSRVDKRGTRWQIAAIPLGGYVKFLGDKDAASAPDSEALGALSTDQRRHTMYGAPLWARAATVAAGPVFNFILAIVVYGVMAAMSGVAEDKPVVGALRPYPFDAPSLQVGDEILAINGAATPDFATYATVADATPAAASVTYHVRRGGVETDVQGPHPLPPLVGGVALRSAAFEAGIKPGDVVLSVDGTKVNRFDEMIPMISGKGGAAVDVKLWRDGTQMDFQLTPKLQDLPKNDLSFETRYVIGLSNGLLFEPQLRSLHGLEPVTAAFNQAWYGVKMTGISLYSMAVGTISSCNLSGAIGMAKIAGDAATSGFETFMMMIAGLSLGIGLLNLFPIPMLDGGHLVFYAFEAVTGKAPSEKFLRVVMAGGLFVVLSFMLFALSNDIFCA